MSETDWRALSEARFEKSAAIIELVESLTDDGLTDGVCVVHPRLLERVIRGTPRGPDRFRDRDDERRQGMVRSHCALTKPLPLRGGPIQALYDR